MVSYATLCLRWGSRILGLRRQQIARNDLEKKLESDFFSEMEKISHRIFAQIARNGLCKNFNQMNFSEMETKSLKRKNTCYGVDDQKQVAGGESRSLKWDNLQYSKIQRRKAV